MTSTTAGAASGALAEDLGLLALARPAPPAAAAPAAAAGRSGVRVSTGFWRARSFAGTDG